MFESDSRFAVRKYFFVEEFFSIVGQSANHSTNFFIVNDIFTRTKLRLLS
jgi:hypothetical protein